MKLHEKNLKKIIRFIEEYGAIKDIKVKNNSIIITPSFSIDGKPSRTIEVELNRANEYTITFMMGDVKKNLP